MVRKTTGSEAALVLIGCVFLAGCANNQNDVEDLRSAEARSRALVAPPKPVPSESEGDSAAFGTSPGDRRVFVGSVTIGDTTIEVNTVRSDASLSAVAGTQRPEGKPHIVGGVNLGARDLSFSVAIPDNLIRLVDLYAELGHNSTGSYVSVGDDNAVLMSTSGIFHVSRADSSGVALEFSNVNLSELGGTGVSTMSARLAGPLRIECFIESAGESDSFDGDEDTAGRDNPATGFTLTPDVALSSPECARLDGMF